MMILMLVFLLTIFLFSSFTISLRLQTINRAIIYMPVEIFETAIVTLNIDIDEGLYFSNSRLTSNLDDYFGEKLSDVMKDYSYSLYYYNQEDGSICTSGKCNAVEVTVTGHYAYSFSYSRTISYEIHKGAKYGQ